MAEIRPGAQATDSFGREVSQFGVAYAVEFQDLAPNLLPKPVWVLLGIVFDLHFEE